MTGAGKISLHMVEASMASTEVDVIGQAQSCSSAVIAVTRVNSRHGFSDLLCSPKP